MQLFLVNFILIVYALSSFVRADAVTDTINLPPQQIPFLLR
jgi:hypothetical protein